MSDNVKKPDQSEFMERDAVSLKVCESAEIPSQTSTPTKPLVVETTVALKDYTANDTAVANQCGPVVGAPADKAQESEIERNTPDEVKHFPSSASKGMKRHRAIIGSCMILSLGLLAISCLDLTHLISSRVAVDSHLNVTNIPKLPELPFPMSYYRSYPTDKTYLLPICELTLSGKRFGFSDREGKIVIPPQFSDVGEFADGLAPFATAKSSDSKWGFIDAKGSVVIPAKYSAVGSFHQGVAVVEVNSEWRLINKAGKFISDLKLASRPHWTGRGYVAEETSLRSGFVNLDGKYNLPPEYTRVQPLVESYTDSRHYNYGNEEYSEEDYRDGLLNYRHASYFLIGKDGRYGVVDGVGNIVLEPQFDDITSFSKGHAAVSIKRAFGFANSDGKVVIKPKYYSVTPFDDLIAVRISPASRYHLIDSRGTPIPGKSVEDIVTERGKWLSEGLAAFGDDNKYGYLDSKGKVAIPPVFEFARPFKNGFAVVKFNGVFRFIDKSGKFASPTEFASVGNFSETGTKAIIAGPLYRFIENESLKNAVRMQRSNRGLTIKE